MMNVVFDLIWLIENGLLYFSKMEYVCKIVNQLFFYIDGLKFGEQGESCKMKYGLIIIGEDEDVLSMWIFGEY